jgi:hypothetical protein
MEILYQTGVVSLDRTLDSTAHQTSKSIMKNNKYPMFLIAFTFFFLVIIPVEAASEIDPPYGGLEELHPDSLLEWTQNLVWGRNTNESVYGNELSQILFEIFEKSATLPEFAKGILALELNRRYTHPASYHDLAHQLFEARLKIARWFELLPENQERFIIRPPELSRLTLRAKKGMLLLEVFAEEALYSSWLIFRSPDIEIFSFNQRKLPCPSPSTTLNSIETCQGDLILSKGTAASSAFLARMTNDPGNYSHATIGFIDGSNSKLYKLESFIADGVKLRRANPLAESPDATKVAFMRAKAEWLSEKGADAIEQAIEEYKIITGARSIKELENLPLVPYDFRVDATDPSTQFCSEVAYVTYKKTVPENENPYGTPWWSLVSEGPKHELLVNFLNTTDFFPAPSDIELNSFYDLAGLAIRPTNLSGDRILLGLADVTWILMEENEVFLSELFRRLSGLGQRPISPRVLKEKIAFIERQLGYQFPQSLKDQLDAMPEGINGNQLLFFAFLNGIAGPKVLKEMQDEEAYRLTQKSVLGLGEMRRLEKNIIKKMLADYVRALEDAFHNE